MFRWTLMAIFLELPAAFNPAAAQVPPFFGGGVVAFDPEIAVIQNGALLDAQATVSDDRKYVTLNMRPARSNVRSLQTFPVSSIVNTGFVGGINLPSGTAVPPQVAAGAQQINPLTNPSPDMLSRASKSWVFTRKGMYLIAPLK
ncbi:MAG TPA: hypothetical protein VHD56_18705 [Tepidisphaeraceae bacterium]|nr:hypothetical protein [Tepidisphaeraceae bacterium]